ncbi:MAG: arylesterase [Desulfuromonadales bacterium]
MKTPWTIIITLVAAVFLFSGGAAAAKQSDGSAIRVAVLGDSLGAGRGLPAAKAFPVRLGVALSEQGYDVDVLDMSVSGDTTAGGLARLEWLLEAQPDLVIVELGGNDALRGLDPDRTRSNLDAILSRLKKADVTVLLAGMRAPRNLGSEYYNKFDRIYPELAEKHSVALYPFFLEGVAGHPEMNQSDGIHPTAEGIEEIVRRILPMVRRLLEEQVASGPSSFLTFAINRLVDVLPSAPV